MRSPRACPPLLLLVLAVTWAPGCVTSTRQRQAQAHVDLGTAYLREGDAPAALGVLRDAVRKDPRNWEGWDRLGLAYWAQAEFEESEKAFSRAVRLVPDKAEVRNNYGLMLMAQGRNQEAISHFEVARKDLLYRRPTLVLSNLGHALYLEGRHDEALAVLDQALARSPDLCQARFHRALVYEGLQRLDGALADYDELIRTCQDEAAGAWYHAAKLLVARGDRTAACTYLGTALERTRPGSDLYEASRKLKALECP